MALIKLISPDGDEVLVTESGVDGLKEKGYAESADAAASDDGLGSKTVAELKQFASDNEIELTASKKADIIAEIEAALKAKSQGGDADEDGDDEPSGDE